MLPSKQRLTRQQVTFLLANPLVKVVFNRAGTIKYTPTPLYGMTVVTGSKQEKSAVKRNTLRRRIYTLSRPFSTLPINAIFYSSKQAYSMKYSELKHFVNDLFAKTQKNT